MSLKEPSKTVSAVIPEKIAEKIDQAVNDGLAVSTSAYICDAIIDRLKKDKKLS